MFYWYKYTIFFGKYSFCFNKLIQLTKFPKFYAASVTAGSGESVTLNNQYFNMSILC